MASKVDFTGEEILAIQTALVDTLGVKLRGKNNGKDSIWGGSTESGLTSNGIEFEGKSATEIVAAVEALAKAREEAVAVKEAAFMAEAYDENNPDHVKAVQQAHVDAGNLLRGRNQGVDGIPGKSYNGQNELRGIETEGKTLAEIRQNITTEAASRRENSGQSFKAERNFTYLEIAEAINPKATDKEKWELAEKLFEHNGGNPKDFPTVPGGVTTLPDGTKIKCEDIRDLPIKEGQEIFLPKGMELSREVQTKLNVKCVVCEPPAQPVAAALPVIPGQPSGDLHVLCHDNNLYTRGQEGNTYTLDTAVKHGSAEWKALPKDVQRAARSGKEGVIGGRLEYCTEGDTPSPAAPPTPEPDHPTPPTPEPDHPTPPTPETGHPTTPSPEGTGHTGGTPTAEASAGNLGGLSPSAAGQGGGQSNGRSPNN